MQRLQPLEQPQAWPRGPGQGERELGRGSRDAPRPPKWRPGPGELSSCCVCLGKRGTLCPCLHTKAEVPRPEHFQAGILGSVLLELKEWSQAMFAPLPQ